MTARKAPARAPKKAAAPAKKAPSRAANKPKPTKKSPSSRAPAKKSPSTRPPARASAPVKVDDDLLDELELVAADADQVDVRAGLVELRSELRRRLRDPETPASAVAAISRELRAVQAELAAIAPEEVSRVDELAARRDARRAGATDTPPAGRRSQPRRRGRGDRPS